MSVITLSTVTAGLKIVIGCKVVERFSNYNHLGWSSHV